MISITIICVGKMKEKFYISAAEEYLKRLGAYAKTEIVELAEVRLPDDPSGGDIDSALSREAAAIKAKIPKGAAIAAMCIEGAQPDSVGFAEMLKKYADGGISKICFIIGGSFGLHDSIKALADAKISMSRMTFPHHLARVMLLEQIYRGFKILEGGKYHK